MNIKAGTRGGSRPFLLLLGDHIELSEFQRGVAKDAKENGVGFWVSKIFCLFAFFAPSR